MVLIQIRTFSEDEEIVQGVLFDILQSVLPATTVKISIIN